MPLAPAVDALVTIPNGLHRRQSASVQKWHGITIL